ncbi:Metallo-dependent phosphatase-like protein [Apiosordaria backusii]|uniref:Metallo-dependent phosphatase-like protein n=1 Tax=Apiosordaria backusii TaxID=314023 RepID=A0AA40A798_9PEZI|nr:Metallo-dependent phosphatase-like protein [Apiosordaria backusii]
MWPDFEKGIAIPPGRNGIIKRPSRRKQFLIVLSLSLLGVFFTLQHWLRDQQLTFLINHHPHHYEALPPLKFKKDGTFQLSIFSDLHFGENAWEPWGPRQDIHSLRVINTVLDQEPTTDFVVLNGDLITGENVYLENGTGYVDLIGKELDKRGVEWGSTYGNHDSDYNLSPTRIYEREKRFRGVGRGGWRLAQRGRWGRGGYKFQEGGEQNKKGRENWVHPKVVGWFKETRERLRRENRGRGVPGLGFVHIPTTAFLEVQERGVDGRRQPGIDKDRPVNRQGEGWCADGGNGEGCEYGGQDGEFMEVVMEEGLLGLFVGHDHGDTWCSDYEKEGKRMYLCFGQHTGYGGYGDWIRGSRQVAVSIEGLRQREMDTWVRLESGKAVGRVRLNESYGRDEYEAVEDERTHLPVDDESKE